MLKLLERVAALEVATSTYGLGEGLDVSQINEMTDIVKDVKKFLEAGE